ncbi:GNAT family N-acetyltransferase [Roseibium sp.]|uniref:GNAT family N-acetyltransferase n=1 Tax=Roseibium sp. TaxID=1936156 RepID=UPI0039EFD787
MALILRPADVKDAPILTDILHRSKASWGYPEDKMAKFREHWRIPEELIRSQHMTVVEDDGVAVAFSGLEPKDDTTLLVDYLFVAPEAQGRGIGDLLLARAEDHARDNNLNRLYLESDHNAGPFYERRGFLTIATRSSEMSPGKDIPLMEKVLKPSVHRLASIDISITDEHWAFETENKAEIAAYFEEAKKRIGLLWNGRTLKLTSFSFENGQFSGRCAETSYAAFLAWRDWGAPDLSARNLFGSAILRSGDGAILYGVMSKKTATGGLIFPPGGNLDLQDITADGRVDVIGAIFRALEEETGLTRKDVTLGEVLVAFDGPRISISQVLDIDRPACELRESILRFSDQTEEQELADMRIIRSSKDLEDQAILPFARAVARELLD